MTIVGGITHRAFTFVRTPLQRRDAPEMLDDPPSVLRDLGPNLHDIRRLNRWFGGTALACRLVHPFTDSCDALVILDIGTGSADIPKALYRMLAGSGMRVSLLAVDSSPHILDEAARYLDSVPVELVLADARSLPFDDNSCDVALCCLALHHFEPHDAVRVLQEMWRVAREAIVVTDLRRGYLAYVGTWLATHVIARNRLTRHDGPLSVLRAYTPVELSCLAKSAGLPSAHIAKHRFFRQSLVARKMAIRND